MKKIFHLLGLLLITIASYGQFNPSLHTVSNTSYAPAQAAPTDARSYFYDATVFKYRPYVSLTEVRSYLNLAKYRTGQFDIIVNTGGTLSNGVITGGTNAVYYFKNGTTDGDLVLKGAVSSVNGQTGNVVTKNADSLRNLQIDTGATAIRDGYLLAFDSTARKWYVVAPATSTTYSQGTGIIIASSTISADNTTALWNASQIRGRSISTGTPAVGNIIKWSGTSWDYTTDLSGIDSGYVDGSTLNIIINSGTGNPDTIFINNVATKSYVDSLVASIPLNPTITTDNTLFGDGSPGNAVGTDTTNWIATIYMVNVLSDRIDSISTTPTGLDTVAHDNTMTGKGTLADKLKVDSVFFATRNWVNDNFIAPTIPTVSAGTGISVGTAPNYVISATGVPTSNPFKALTIESYGGVSDATVPASGANANGTNNTPALNSMLAASSEGQWCIVPSGNWLFSTAPDSISTKKIYLLVIGTTYHNQQNFIVIKNASGAFRQHRIIHTGIAWGRVNLPTHNSAGAVGGRVSPNWAAYTGTAFTVYNTDQVEVWFNKIVGWKNGIEVKGGGGNGGQENEFHGGWIQECANGIVISSVDGSSFCDKNKFYVARIGGGLAIKMDGYSGVASNGETWNGAMRSNEFYVLLEFCDSAIFAWGDITEPEFHITVEGGTNTGILGSSPFDCKLNNNTGGANSSNNYVRSPDWSGQGVYGAQRLGTAGQTVGSIGVNATIHVDMWAQGSTAYYGNVGYTDGTGKVVIYTPYNTSQSVRTAAPTYISFIDLPVPENEVSTISGAYTVAAGVTRVRMNHAAGTVTLPSATAYPTFKITIINENANPLTVSNSASGFANTVAGFSTRTYYSNGTTTSAWFPQ